MKVCVHLATIEGISRHPTSLSFPLRNYTKLLVLSAGANAATISILVVLSIFAGAVIIITICIIINIRKKFKSDTAKTRAQLHIIPSYL